MTIDIDKLKQLCDAATPGPWTADVWIETDGNGWRATGPHHEDHDCWTEPGCPDEQAAQRDAAFIVAAREAVLPLIKALEVAQEALRECAAAKGCAGDALDRIQEILNGD